MIGDSTLDLCIDMSPRVPSPAISVMAIDKDVFDGELRSGTMLEYNYIP